MTDIAKLATWFASHDTGLSSRAIAAKMAGADMNQVDMPCPPSDPSDLGRCLRLLELFPEWKPRMGEMASVSESWARILPHWDEVVRSMEREVGLDWSKGTCAPATFKLMKARGF